MGDEQRVLYTGFYLVDRTPSEPGPCVKVVFPMPRGNATVLLRPEIASGGALRLDSSGKRFGDAGFYRVSARDGDRIAVWRIQSLKELFHVYVDAHGVLRCDHTVKFLGFRVLRLHYKVFRAVGVSSRSYSGRGVTAFEPEDDAADGGEGQNREDHERHEVRRAVSGVAGKANRTGVRDVGDKADSESGGGAQEVLHRYTSQ